jgi:hypothetical protein
MAMANDFAGGVGGVAARPCSRPAPVGSFFLSEGVVTPSECLMGEKIALIGTGEFRYAGHAETK